MLNYEFKNPDKLPDWLRDYPVTLTQFIVYLYANKGDFMLVFMTEDVLTALVGTLFPTVTNSGTPSREDSGDAADGAVPAGKDDRDCVNDGRSRCAFSVEKAATKSDDTLSQHPARRNVINFMRTMIVDSLSLQPTQKSSPVLDLLLDAQPENTTHAQQCR